MRRMRAVETETGRNQYCSRQYGIPAREPESNAANSGELSYRRSQGVRLIKSREGYARRL